MPDAQQGRSRARGGGDRLRVQLVGAGRGGDSPQADSKTDPAHRLELLLRACGVVRVQQLELLRPVAEVTGWEQTSDGAVWWTWPGG